MRTTASKSDLKVKILFWGRFGCGEQYFFLTSSATSCSWYCLSCTSVICQHYLSPTPPSTRLKRLIRSSLSLGFHHCNSIWQSHNYVEGNSVFYLFSLELTGTSQVSTYPCLYVLMYLFTKKGFSIPALFITWWKTLHVLSNFKNSFVRKQKKIHMWRRQPSSPKCWLRYKQKELGDLFFKTPMFTAASALLGGWTGYLLRILLTWLSPWSYEHVWGDKDNLDPLLEEILVKIYLLEVHFMLLSCTAVFFHKEPLHFRSKSFKTIFRIYLHVSFVLFWYQILHETTVLLLES